MYVVCRKGRKREEENEGTHGEAGRESLEGQADADGGRLRFWSATCYAEGGKWEITPRESEERCGSSEAMYSYIRVPSVQRSHSRVPGLAQVSDHVPVCACTMTCPPPPGSKVSISQVPFPPSSKIPGALPSLPLPPRRESRAEQSKGELPLFPHPPPPLCRSLSSSCSPLTKNHTIHLSTLSPQKTTD